MSSLSTCIKKAGKALSRDDSDAIRDIYQNMVDSGAANPAQAAVDEYLGLMQEERQSIVDQVRAEGGRVGTQLKISRGNKEQEVAKEISSVSLLDGTETLNIPDARILKGDRIKANAKQLAKALVARTKAANRGRDLGSQTARSKEIVTEAIALETEAAIQRTGHAGDWYTTVLHNAVNIVSELHPELKTDQEARSAFMLGVAITSNGADVKSNAAWAEQIYTEFKKTGRFPEDTSLNAQAPAMNQAFELSNSLIDKWGLPTFMEFLGTEFTVGELKQLGFEVSGENVDHATHGSIIFGPKIGGGFYQNLMGNYDPLTMDRWFMRTWGRLTGTLLPDLVEIPEKQGTRLADAIRANPEKVEALGYNVDEVLENDEKLIDLAQELHREYARSGFKDKSELNLAGKSIDNIMTAPIIAPRSGGERAWIREVTGLAVEKLNQRGVPVNAASMQALIWYPEKDLYLNYGVGNAKSVPTDYEQEFEKLALAAGVDQQRIDAARTGDSNERPAEGVGATEPGERGVEAPSAPSLAPKERTRLLHKEVTRRIREQLLRPYRRGISKGADRQLEGVNVTARYQPEVKTRNAYNAVNLSTPEFVELEASQPGAELFASKIQAAKQANAAGAAVYQYPTEDYAGMRLFLTPDGKAGFALNGDDIVSAFKFPGEGMPGVAQSMVALAVAEGGRRLDAFDTVLPSIYSLQGFRVVSRIPWDDEQAPDGWSKEAFSRWNEGEPDVVFMVYDQEHQNAYTGRYEGQMVQTFDEAARIQQEAVESLTERNKTKRSVLFSLPKETEDRINRDPESPLSRLHKLGATMEDQANAGPTSVAYNTIREFWNNGRIKFILSSVPRRNLGDFLPGDRAPSVREYIQLANRMEGRRNELLARYEDVASNWASWARKDKRTAARLADLMHAATLAGVDPAKPYRALKKPENMTDADKRLDAIRREQHIMFKDAYDSLNPKARETYIEVRDTYVKMREDVEAALEKRVADSVADAKTKQAVMDQLRQKFEAGRVAGPYFPLMRFGELWGVAKDEDGNVVSYSRFENRADQKEWIKEFKAEGYKVDQGRRSEEVGEFVRQIDPRFATRVAALAKASGDTALVDEIWQMYLRSLPEMSMRKRFLHRKGRLGFHVDALRSYANVTFRGANQQAKLEYMHRMKNSLDTLQTEVRDIESDPELSREFDWAMPLHDELTRRHDLAMSPNTNPIAVNITGLGFLWYLGFTPAAAVVNLTQTPLVAFPVLSAKFNVLGAQRELLRASGTVASSWRSERVEDKLRGDEHRAFKEARRIGLFEKTQAHDLAGVTEVGMQQYGGPYHRIMEIGSLLFHSAESFNREVTFLAAYRLGRQNGMSHDDALVTGEDLTWDSHFDYNSTNRPRWMQNNLMRVLTLFKQYSLNMTYRMARDFNNAVLRSDLSKEERIEAGKRFGGMMMVAGLMAGYTGLPSIFTQSIKYVVEALVGDEDDAFDAEDAMRAHLAEQYGAKAAEAIMKGPVDAMTGMTLSNRVSLGQLWFRDPGPYDEGEKYFLHMLMEALGPIPATIKDITVTGKDLLEDGHIDRGLEKMTPKFIRDLLRAYRFATEGALTLHSPADVLVPEEDFSPVDIFWQAFGFTPAELTMQYEQNNALRSAEKALTDSRQKHIDRYMLAIFTQDKPAAREAAMAIGEFNQRNPTLAITGDTLESAGKTRMQRSARSIGGVTLNKNLVFLYKDLLFTDEERLNTSGGEEE